ncbi:DnaJ domain protein [Aspergillus sclerotialis]|uniref:DnaJ domain protein n=1 Tax=Aspergillus sclerotialis TaxID=2070753 RepID=A0A3A2ZGU1_9EURO|nr:DnaJ domain protein [Aspergillus sclerotialis]
MSPKLVDYYEVLGVTKEATLKDINSAYKKLALKHHPDKGDGSKVEFLKIQQAVETLRDPDLRKKHDDHLRKYSFRRSDPFQFPEGYTGWRPFGASSDTTFTDRYMYSYGNSVHMDPNSPASAEERARWDNYRNFGDDLRPQEVPSENDRWNIMKEIFKAKLKRDEWSQRSMAECFDGGGDEDVLGEAAGDSQYVDSGEEEDPEYVPQRKGESQWFKYAKQECGILLDLSDDGGQTMNTTSPSFGGMCNEKVGEETTHPLENAETEDSFNASNLSSAEYETAIQSEAGSYFGYDSESDDDKILGNEDGGTRIDDNDIPEAEDDTYTGTPTFYEARSTKTTTTTSSTTSSKLSTATNTTPTNLEPLHPLSHFVPYFQSKLSHPSNSYTISDLHTELKGIVLETYCGWLESVRISFPDSMPLPNKIETDQENCLHLGYWVKQFDSPECEVCHRWRPIYALTCPSCGLKRCVACKFDGWAGGKGAS